jgi:general L-amino acid transport system substrate-binding protein
MRIRTVVVMAALLSSLCALSKAEDAVSSPTLAKIREHGTLTCGVIREDAEYSTEDDHGSRRSFDEDLCKAFSIAALGRAASLKIVSFLDSESALKALRSGKIDVIASVSADFSHSTAQNIRLSRPVLYDGVGFLVPRSSRISSAQGLSGHKICFLAETETEVSLRSWFEKQHLDLLPFPFQEEGEMEAAYITHNCTALAGDLTRLVNIRVSFGSLAKDYILLPEVISKDPLAAATRDDDEQWSNVIAWTMEALIAAEEEGVTSANIKTKASSTSPEMQKLLGHTRDLGAPLGLEDDWAANVIQATGNFGEIYARSFGPGTEHDLPRGPNLLWSKGGLMFSLPLK